MHLNVYMAASRLTWVPASSQVERLGLFTFSGSILAHLSHSGPDRPRSPQIAPDRPGSPQIGPEAGSSIQSSVGFFHSSWRLAPPIQPTSTKSTRVLPSPWSCRRHQGGVGSAIAPAAGSYWLPKTDRGLRNGINLSNLDRSRQDHQQLSWERRRLGLSSATVAP